MKKIMSRSILRMMCMLLCLLLSGICTAQAEDWSGEFEMPEWAVLSRRDTLLSVMLPQQDDQSVWRVTLSHADRLEMVTFTAPDRKTNEEDQLWTANFRATGLEWGRVILQFTQVRGETHMRTCLLEMDILADGTLVGVSSLEIDDTKDETMYYLQVGAYAVQENAYNQLNRLTESGFDGLIKYDGKLYRVQAGAFAHRANAERQLEALQEVGFWDAYITTTPMGEVIALSETYDPIFYITYTVEKNDTMWGLARRFLGDGKLWTLIAELNDTSMEIYVGQVLLIPQ